MQVDTLWICRAASVALRECANNPSWLEEDWFQRLVPYSQFCSPLGTTPSATPADLPRREERNLASGNLQGCLAVIERNWNEKLHRDEPVRQGAFAFVELAVCEAGIRSPAFSLQIGSWNVPAITKGHQFSSWLRKKENGEKENRFPVRDQSFGQTEARV